MYLILLVKKKKIPLKVIVGRKSHQNHTKLQLWACPEALLPAAPLTGGVLSSVTKDVRLVTLYGDPGLGPGVTIS